MSSLIDTNILVYRFDAHILSYAEHYGIGTLYSEDSEHNRVYGTVRAVNPFS